jgi:hypothetical protein
MFLGYCDLISPGDGLEGVCISAQCVDPLFLSGGEVGGVYLVCRDRRLLFEMYSTKAHYGGETLCVAVPCLLK